MWKTARKHSSDPAADFHCLGEAYKKAATIDVKMSLLSSLGAVASLPLVDELLAMALDDLFECISQALLNAVDRDAISGWGAVVHVVTRDGVTTKTLKGRMD